MRQFKTLVSVLVLLTLLCSSFLTGSSVFPTRTAQNQLGIAVTQAASSCTFLSAPGTIPAFCDTFDGPAGTGNRSGDLNGTVWGVSRIEYGGSGGGANSGQGANDTWVPATLSFCTGNQSVLPDNDVQICNGQLREGAHDNGGQTLIAMYPKQPFDIAGRTGTAVFEVSNNSQGPHASWPEFWYTDQPIPAPNGNTLSGVDSLPRNGLGISFANVQAAPTGSCPGSPWPLPQPVVSVDRLTLVTNYGVTYPDFTLDGCVKESLNLTSVNHFEVHVSSTQLQVYGTDAGTISPLKLLAHAPLTLPLTRGLVWIEDVHYNGNKFNSQGTNTFSWDNVGFDGPVLPRDLTFDVNEPKDSYNSADGSIQLGFGGHAFSWSIPNIVQKEVATSAVLLLNIADVENKPTFVVTVNGHTQPTFTWPFVDTDYYNWRTVAVPLTLGDVVNGTNVVGFDFGANAISGVVANVDLLLIGAGGVGGTPLPTPTPGATTATPTAAATAVATNTPTRTMTPVPTGSILGATQTTGGSFDTGNGNNLSTSAVRTGAIGTTITALSAFTGPIDPAHTTYGLAVYTDNNGKPGSPIAFVTGTLTVANGWNSLPVTAALQANTNYWLVYNTSSTNSTKNTLYLVSSGTVKGGYSGVVTCCTFPSTATWTLNTPTQYALYATLSN